MELVVLEVEVVVVEEPIDSGPLVVNSVPKQAVDAWVVLVSQLKQG